MQYGDVWLVVEQVAGPTVPTRGRSIDHLGWIYDDLDAAAAALKTRNVTFTMEPRVFAGRKIAFVEGPGGTQIELVKASREPGGGPREEPRE